MAEKNSLSMTQKELLIRIDERQKAMESRLETIEGKLISTSEHNYLLNTIKEHDSRLDQIERWQSRIIGYGAAAGAMAGIIFNFVKDFIKHV